jgi:D-alanyl-D-alanine carboxypeptidase
MKTILILSLALLSSSIMFAQIDFAKMNQLFANYDTNQKAMLSMCISENGKIVYDKSIGYSNLKTKEKANVYSLYHIGSITKMFTSVMIFQLIDEKKLTLETKLNKFFPTIPNSDKITVSNLLNHRSGLFSFTSDSLYTTFLNKEMSEADLISMFSKYKPDFEPNTKGDYSNTNYVLLTFIIEKLTKNTYSKELIKRVCSKIGLADTRVAITNETEENVAKSYEYENNHWVNSTETHMSIPRGAGAIISTPRDLCIFIEALFAGKLMSASSFDKMKTIEEDYGRGIFQIPFATKKGYGHSGSIDGFGSTLGYFPDDKVAFCILGNAWNYPMNDVAIGILSIYYKKDYTIPSFEKKPMSKEAAKSIEGIYRNSMLGMKVTIKKEQDSFTAQATGQSPFTLVKVSELEYKFDPAKIVINFIKDSNADILSFKLTQNGHELVFEKE